MINTHDFQNNKGQDVNPKNYLESIWIIPSPVRKTKNVKKNHNHMDPVNILHALKGNRVDGPKIRRSTIPNIGFGLFADKSYKKNDLITVYGGSLHFKSVEGEYVFSLQESPPICVDGKDNFHAKEKGRWCNHGYSQPDIPLVRDMYQCYDEVAISNKKLSHNATNAIKRHPKKKPYLFQNRANTEYYVTRKNNLPICYIRAIRDVEIGEELFVDYGDQYWSSVKACN
jgi:hypothetical protein